MLKDPVVIVTGAGSGIGATVARYLGDRGGITVAVDIDTSAVEAVVADIKAAGHRAIAVTADVTDEQAVARLVSVACQMGEVETVIACAGVAATGLAEQMPMAMFDQIMAVNVRSVFLLAKYGLPALRKSRGSFLAIASDAALIGCERYAAYCASKHAVAGMIKSLALDHGHEGVRSNAICPGYVETPMLERLLKELGGAAEEWRQTIPLGRFATPEDVAKFADFVTSEAGRYLNGALIPLDGGGLAGPYRGVDA